MDKISVIVPIYNVEKYLGDCLESILLQEVSCEMEVLLINDGSTDSSADIAAYYEDKYENVFLYSFENGGLSEARNRGIEKATGKYIFFIDSDDLLERGYLEKLYRASKVSDADIVYAGFTAWTDKKRIINRDILRQQGIFTGIEWINMRMDYNDWNNQVWCALYKKSFFQDNRIKFHENIKLYEDIYFSNHEVLKAKKIISVPEYGYLYRIREESLSHNGQNKEKDIKACIQILNILVCEYSKMTIKEQKTIGRVLYQIVSMTLYYIGDTKPENARQYYKAMQAKELLKILRKSITNVKEFVKYLIFRFCIDKYYYFVKKEDTGELL